MGVVRGSRSLGPAEILAMGNGSGWFWHARRMERPQKLKEEHEQCNNDNSQHDLANHCG
jgi:hypothetical protein